MNLEQERARFEKAYQNAGIGSDEPDPLVPDGQGSYKKVVPAFMWKGWLLYASSESKTSYAWQSGYAQAKEEEALANMHLVPPKRQEDCPLCGRKHASFYVGAVIAFLVGASVPWIISFAAGKV